MKKIVVVAIMLLVAANGGLLWKNWMLQGDISASTAMAADSDAYDIGGMDLRGMYAFPGFGKGLAPFAKFSDSTSPSLTVAVFFSAKTQCSMTLSELPALRRLIPILHSRHQTMIAVTAIEDSLAIDSLLKTDSIAMPILAFEKGDQGLDFAKMGLSAHFMPFKVVYDSAFDAIYMRTGDNSAETQASFERAVLKLSALIAEGKL